MNKPIHLPYGRTYLELSLPDEKKVAILAAKKTSANEFSQEEIIKQALENPVESSKLRDLSAGKKKIVVIASDHTRPVPSKIITPLILEEIRRGNPDAEVVLLISTGTHRASTRDELIEKFGCEIVDKERIIIHNALSSEVACIGSFSSGNDLMINKIAADADLLVAEGFIEPHFFAGFSGGRKSVFPGITNLQSVMENHCAEFIAHPSSRTGILQGNPIHEEMVHAARLANLAFVVNVVLDENKKVVTAFAGHFLEAHLHGTSYVNSLACVEKSPADIVISTNGGYPLDQNIYQAVKGMTSAEATCNPGGVIIMVSECCDGHGGNSFLETFSGQESLDEIESEILARKKDETIMDQWQSQILVRILRKHAVIMVTKADKELVNRFRMHHATSVHEALKLAEEILHRKVQKITVIPDGISVIIH